MSKLYNINFLNDLMGGNELEIKSLIHLFIDITPSLLEEMKTAAMDKNYRQAGDLAHKLKSSLRLMGISTLVDEVIFIEENGRAGTKTNQLAKKIKDISKSIIEIVEEMKMDIGSK